MQAQVFVPEGPEMDIATKSWRFSVDFFGNTCWNPKFFLALKNLSGTSPGLLRSTGPGAQPGEGGRGGDDPAKATPTAPHTTGGHGHGHGHK